MSRLTIDDILDLREYERIREDFRAEIIQLKRLRRIPLGEIITLLFESEATIKFQIQEMARAEKMISDEAISVELETYNPLIPSRNQLTATVFVELTSKGDLVYWLPRLVGIERSFKLNIGGGRYEVRAAPEADHESQLTRQDITSTVHYIAFDLTEEESKAFANSQVVLEVDHPEYRATTELSPAFRASIVADWT